MMCYIGIRLYYLFNIYFMYSVAARCDTVSSFGWKAITGVTGVKTPGVTFWASDGVTAVTQVLQAYCRTISLQSAATGRTADRVAFPGARGITSLLSLS